MPGTTILEEPEAGEVQGGTMESETDETVNEPLIPLSLGPNDPPPTMGQWAEYLPGGETICS